MPMCVRRPRSVPWWAMQLSQFFALSEFACKGILPPVSVRNHLTVLCDQLDVLRGQLGKPVVISSGWRSLEHNAAVGGAPGSLHITGKAADLQVPGLTPQEVHGVITDLIEIGLMRDGGLGLYARHVHYDIGPRRRWAK